MDAPTRLSLPAGFTARPVRHEDLDDVVALVRACEAVDSGVAELDRDDLLAAWSLAGMDLSTMTLAVFEGDALVAEAEVQRYHGDVGIHPDHRGRGIGTAILPWVEDVARAQGSFVRQVVNERATDAGAFLTRHGYQNAFTSWILAMPLGEDQAPPVLPEGVTFRDYRPGLDDREIYRLVEDAFSEWEMREPLSFEDWATLTIRRGSFAPWHMILVAEEATGELVGMVYLIDYDELEEGWIQQVATRATHRHRGIARAMLNRAFALYRERGKAAAGLNTDSRSGALGVYERVGMTVRSTYANYVKEFERLA